MTDTNNDRPGLRALIAVRLSVRTDESTSPKRQREAGEAEARRLGAEVVGYGPAYTWIWLEGCVADST